MWSYKEKYFSNNTYRISVMIERLTLGKRGNTRGIFGAENNVRP
jgi:hypothetical protein